MCYIHCYWSARVSIRYGATVFFFILVVCWCCCVCFFSSSSQYLLDMNIVHLLDRFIYYCVENGTDTKPTLYLRYMQSLCICVCVQSNGLVYFHISIYSGGKANTRQQRTSPMERESHYILLAITIQHTELIHKDLLIIFRIFGCPFILS